MVEQKADGILNDNIKILGCGTVSALQWEWIPGGGGEETWLVSVLIFKHHLETT